MLLFSLQLSAGTSATCLCTLQFHVKLTVDRLSGENWFSNFIIVFIFLTHRTFNGF